MQQLGQKAEQHAKAYLEDQGLEPKAQNVHCRFGELDLVMADGNTLVFVEVKYRRSASFGGAVAAVSASKQQKLRMAAQWYLQQQGLSEQPCRFDVLAFEGGHIQWIKNAF